MDNEPLAKKKNRKTLILAVTLAIAAALLLICAVGGYFYWIVTGNYEVDTIEFRLTDAANATSGIDGGTEPGVWINTNIRQHFTSKTITSSKPYSIAIDKTDTSFTYTSAVFTRVDVTYDDGGVEASRPSLPWVIEGRSYTSTNSVSGGQITETKMYVISGSIPDAITRDEPFTLILEGHFIMADGSQTPFTIEQHYDVVIEKSIQRAEDVLQDK